MIEKQMYSKHYNILSSASYILNYSIRFVIIVNMLFFYGLIFRYNIEYGSFAS